MLSVSFFIGKMSLINGIARVVYNIAEELKKDKLLNISVVSPYCESDAKDMLKDKFSIYDLHLKGVSQKERYFKVGKPLHQFVQQNQIDILIIAGTEWCIPVYLACKSFHSLKLVSWEHQCFITKPKFRLEWFGRRLACKKFSGHVSITKKDYNYYRKYIVNDKKLFQIYNLSNFTVKRKAYKKQSHKIISCGYLAAIKGFDMLIKVAAKFFIKHKQWQWDIYGEGPERVNLQRMIYEYHLEKHVFLKGYCSNINELYGDYSFFVLTSRSEGMGMVLIEAQKAGLPIVSFDINCGPSDVIVNEENGYLIKPFDIDDMEKKICQLIDSEALREKFSSASEMKHEELKRDYIVAKWYKLFEYVLQNNS